MNYFWLLLFRLCGLTHSKYNVFDRLDLRLCNIMYEREPRTRQRLEVQYYIAIYRVSLSRQQITYHQYGGVEVQSAV